MIKTDKITKTYYGKGVQTKALLETSLEIKSGDFVSIIGKSGAGKSTLIHQLSLLDSPNTGSIFIDKEDVSNLTRKERASLRLKKMGFIFQDYALIPELTAVENVLLPILMQGTSLTKAKKIAKKVLKEMDLAEKINNLPNELSGGEQQRVSIARAVAHKPKILFADEPTANLDTKTSDIVLKYLEKLNKDGITIVMVTHEIDYAKRAKRIIEISDGKIVSDK